MKAQDLKKSILQYAMQGKLVPQDSNDEPASELLKRIKTEKEQLIKDGKILKKKKLAEFTENDIPFKIPSNWVWTYLSDVSIIQEGAGIRTFQYRDSGIQLLTVTNILEGGIDLNKSVKYIDKDEYLAKYSHLSPILGDIVTACSGGSWGKSAIYDQQALTMLNTSTLRLRFFSDLSNNKYLYYITKSNCFKKQLEVQLSGMQPNFGYQHYSKILIPLPPLAEQKRIVEKLEEILPLVDEYGKNEEILSEMNQKLPKQIRQSILQYAVQGKLVEQNHQDEPASELLKRIKAQKEQLIKDGKIKKEKPLPPITQDEIPYALPQGWQWVRLGNVVNYGSTGTIDSRENLNENTWILDLEDIEKESSKLLVKNIIKNKSFNSSKKIFKKGDVLYGKLRPYLDKVIVAEENGICTTEIIPLRIYYGIDSYYLKWFLKSPMFIQYVNQLTYGVKMPRLGTEDGKNALFALPPLAEQKRIVAKVEELLNLVNKLEL